MAHMQPHAKLWIEIDGKIVLSHWRVALLEAVEATGSLAKAAEQLGVPYRTASYKLREIEANLDVRLVSGQRGGLDGGGSRLTPAGHDYVRRWRAFADGLDAWVEAHFQAAFSST